MDSNAERGLATSVFTPGEIESVDYELKLVRCLYGNYPTPASLDDISTYFGTKTNSSGIFLVTFEELRRRGIAEGVSLGGRDFYDLTKEFRELVNSEHAKYQARLNRR